MPAARNTCLTLAAGLVVLALSLPASAHDFWIQPLSFWTSPGGSVMTSLQVGHGEARQRWDSDSSRVARFYSVGPGGPIANHLPALRRSAMDRDHLVPLGAPGAHILVLETGHADSELPAIRFTDYLKEEGLTPALELRARSRTTNRPGREIYSRRAKALVQVGPASASQQTLVTKPLGLTLEIVPEVNPYAPGAGDRLPVQVIYKGRALPGALVKLNNLASDGRPVQVTRTDRSGRAVFRVPRTGAWQLNVIWTEPLQGHPKAEFDTTFSSLTLGFPNSSRPL